MAWEQRGKNRRVYCLSEKIPGTRKVRRTYLGNGPLAHLVAQGDAIEQAERRLEVSLREQSRARWRSALAASRTAALALQVMARVDRYGLMNPRSIPMAKAFDPTTLPADLAALRALLTQPEGGREAADRFLDARPGLVEHAGDAGKIAQALWIRLIAGQDTAMTDLVSRRVAQIRQELLDHDAGLLERLVVDQFCLCWLQSNYTSAFAAENATTARQANFLHTQQLKAQRRLATAVKTLIRIRQKKRLVRSQKSPRPRRSSGS